MSEGPDVGREVCEKMSVQLVGSLLASPLMVSLPPPCSLVSLEGLLHPGTNLTPWLLGTQELPGGSSYSAESVFQADSICRGLKHTVVVLQSPGSLRDLWFSL